MSHGGSCCAWGAFAKRCTRPSTLHSVGGVPWLSWGRGVLRGQPSWSLPPTMAFSLVLRIENPKWVLVVAELPHSHTKISERTGREGVCRVGWIVDGSVITWITSRSAPSMTNRACTVPSHRRGSQSQAQGGGGGFKVNTSDPSPVATVRPCGNNL